MWKCDRKQGSCVWTAALFHLASSLTWAELTLSDQFQAFPRKHTLFPHSWNFGIRGDTYLLEWPDCFECVKWGRNMFDIFVPHNSTLDCKIYALHPSILVTARSNRRCHKKKKRKPCHHNLSPPWKKWPEELRRYAPTKVWPYWHLTFDFWHLTYVWHFTWTNGPMEQWTNGPIHQWTNGPMNQWTNGPMD